MVLLDEIEKAVGYEYFNDNKDAALETIEELVNTPTQTPQPHSNKIVNLK